MDISKEMIKSKIIEDIYKFVMGVTIEPDMQRVEDNLIERCNAIGLDYYELKEQCLSEIPTKRAYSKIIEDTQIDGIDRGLSLVFETILRGKELDTRELDDEYSKQAYSRGFSTEHRGRCRAEILRALCISLKNETIGYNNNGIDLRKFLSQKGINPNLNITKEQLDYIHSIDLSNLENFLSNIEVSLLPPKLFESTKFWEAFSRTGDRMDTLYEMHNNKAYRIYINTPPKSDRTDEFLTDYMKMCISRKIPFEMKGSQDKGKKAKDNTVLYISEENLLDYIQILDQLSVLHPETIASFGEPPVLTQGLSNNGKNALNNWFGFADLGQYDVGGTYNDRTMYSALNAFMVALYASIPYGTKLKIQENGFSLKSLLSLVKFEPSYIIQTLNKEGKKKRLAIFPEGIEEIKKGLKSPLDSEGRLKPNNGKMLQELISLCREELMQIIENPEKKKAMYEKFKKYYILIENYFKYNSSKNMSSLQYTFEDYRELPTTISISLYQKYKQKLDNCLLNSAIEATEIETRTGAINEQVQAIRSIEGAKTQKQKIPTDVGEQ